LRASELSHNNLSHGIGDVVVPLDDGVDFNSYSIDRVREEVERETKRLFESIVELLELACRARESGELRIESIVVGSARELERCYRELLGRLKGGRV